MRAEFRYALREDQPAIAHFLRTHWSPDNVYARTPRLFEWTFGRRDLWDRDGYSFALAEADGEIVGILGAIPFELNAGGRLGKALWLANLMVRPDYRKGSIAVQLLRMMDREPFEAVVAFRISSAAAPFYRALRWSVIDDIPRHLAVIAGAEEQMARVLQLAHPEWNSRRAADVAHCFRMDRTANHTPCSDVLRASRDWDEAAWDENDWPALAGSRIGAARTSVYLNWRYRRHPVFRYRFVTIAEGERTGLAVWRLETIRTPEAADAGRFARLVEFLPASRDNAERLLRAFLHVAANAGAMAADFFGYHRETNCFLSQAGMKAVAEHPDGLAVPSRFQPLDGKTGPIASAVRLRSGLPVPRGQRATDPGAWYWTKSDGDQDRPN